MKNHIEYKTSGVCSRMIIVDTEDGVITDCKFVGGCAGNTQGVAALVIGMKIEDAIGKIKGIKPFCLRSKIVADNRVSPNSLMASYEVIEPYSVRYRISLSCLCDIKISSFYKL